MLNSEIFNTLTILWYSSTWH